LVSGTAGTGKSSLAAAFVEAACRRGERCLYLAFEESRAQIIRNMRSIGINLDRPARSGLLHFHTVRPSIYGLEMHLVAIHDLVQNLKPRIVVLDPLSNLMAVGDRGEVKSMLTRLIDFFKSRQITTFFTSLTEGGSPVEQSEVGVSSLMDTWLLVRNLEQGGERNRGLYVLKSRGMGHSNQIREFRLSRKGIELLDVYVGGGAVLTGASRVAQEALDRAEAKVRRQQAARLKRAINRKAQAVESQIAVLRAGLEAELEELKQGLEEEELRSRASGFDRHEMAAARMADRPSREPNNSE
jgi:circadian clock protein KaiC